VVFVDVDLYPSHNMVCSCFLPKSSHACSFKDYDVLMHSSWRAHVPKFEPNVIPSYVMTITLVIFMTRYDLKNDTYGVLDGLGVYTFNFC
jgi:hypothetical protein